MLNMKKFYFAFCCVLFSLSIPNLLYAQSNISFGSQINYTQLVNDIWGYTDAAGKEYALVGTQTGLAIVDVSDPAAATELHFIEGPNNTWRDVHTWSHYAYMITESASSGGLLIIDLAGLPSTITTYYTAMDFGYYSAHAMYIDDATGVAYLYGGKSTLQGNATFFIDLATNPISPTYLGKYTTYVHDGYVRNDTMWTCEIYNGRFSVVDVSNKANPIVLASQATPYSFTHAAWLSDNSQYLFITDEKNAAPIVAYDVSDIYDIKEIDRYRTKPISDSMTVAHNVYVKGNFLVSSYYTSGITIADITYPYNIIEVGNYDTSPLTGGGYNGCWGVFPYFASETILATDRQEGLFALSPTYINACWLEGTVSNILTSNPIANAQVQIIGVEAGFDHSKFSGFYATGTGIAGTYQVVASANGYYSDTISITLNNGVLSTQNFELLPLTYCSETPTGLILKGHSDTSAVFEWDIMPNAQQYLMQYRSISDTIWQTQYSNDTTTTLMSLVPCTEYVYRLQSICNYGINSPYSAIDTFTTNNPSAKWEAINTFECLGDVDLNQQVIGWQGGTWSGGSYISSNGIFSPANLATDAYIVTYTVEVGNCSISQTNNIGVAPCAIPAHIKVILGGAYNPTTDMMGNNLASYNLLPHTQPYNTAPWHYNGNETFATLPANAVDWVLVELRPIDDITVVNYQAAAILLQNGTLLSSDGTSGVQFVNADTAEYYITVRHRNHLAIISNTAVSLPNTSTEPYDFTAINAAMGPSQTYFVDNGGVYAMRPGDMNGNGVITVNDFNVYLPQTSQINIYNVADLNLDRTVTTTDFNQYLPQSSFIGISLIRY